MEMLCPLSVLVVLLSAHAAHTHQGLKGLSCVNDFVSNVSCTWNSTPVAPGVDCLIHGVKVTWVRENTRNRKLIMRSCKLKQHGTAPPGCSLVFESKFTFYEYMPSIHIECNGKLLENLTNYDLSSHIKMNPPGVPNVTITANDTWISWNPGSPLSEFIHTFDFQVQVKLKTHTWEGVKTLSTQAQKLRIPACQSKERCQVRVRVKPSEIVQNTMWSSWSPTTSWMGTTTSQDQDWFLDQPSVVQGVMLSVGLFVIILIIYMSCINKGHLKVKPVPNPSKYFPTLQSVHGENLKKWLNPLSASESFFTAQPHDHISPVEVCESWDVVPSTSPSSSSTGALLHFRSYPSAGSNTSRVADNSSSSSCFSNMGYFMSSSSSSIAQTDPSPAYFIYKDDFHNVHNNHNLHLSLCPSLTSSPAYESLKREPQSPDSGFGIGQEDEEAKNDEKGWDVEGEEASDVHPSSPLLILPLHLPSVVCPPSSSALPPPHPPSLTQMCSDSQEVDDVPVAAAGGSYAAWPVASAMCRSSSMPVEPCKTGYLTIKELQTTFSNKSI
ncbi:interleukin-2 receptor subunit beta isoform X2 [Toxotes jaculatrix]|uniref:interleukin-2 receptor subunit beta isoform X2 n=1 Tax=Toxotes jaculatrix TaxID=941984 RepID=UPI001B3B0E73|nr:interleukin-2 receptor subunit beta isoform X2 [Toxotes jaculatrix]